MRLVLPILAAFFLFSCRHSQVAESIEKYVYEKTPYKLGKFDCTERAAMGAVILEQSGFKTTYLIQKNRWTGDRHKCVAWFNGEERGTILCQKGDGWEYESFDE